MHPVATPSKIILAALGLLAIAAAIVLVATDALTRAEEPAAPEPASPAAVPGGDSGSELERARKLEAERDGPRPDRRREWIRWRDSSAIGLPHAGSLVRGVRVPAEGDTFFTWDPIKKRQPNRAWRRWGTDVLVRTVVRIARDFARENPGAPRIAIGDLSRPRGGDFGPQWGSIGHASHQNGLDVDVYYPLRSGRERAPLEVSEIDMALAQDLVDRFVEAGAVKVFVGPSTPLDGPAEIVQPLVHHDNHLHVRLEP